MYLPITNKAKKKWFHTIIGVCDDRNCHTSKSIQGNSVTLQIVFD